MLKSNINQLHFNINDNFELNLNNFFIISNLIFSLSLILNKELGKINFKVWNLKESLDFIEKYDFEIIEFLKNNSCSNWKNENPIFLKIKTLRDILNHFFDYKIDKDNDNSYILIKILFFKNFIYFFIIKNQKSLKIYEYDFEEIKKILTKYLLQFD